MSCFFLYNKLMKKKIPTKITGIKKYFIGKKKFIKIDKKININKP